MRKAHDVRIIILDQLRNKSDPQGDYKYFEYLKYSFLCPKCDEKYKNPI